MPRPLLSLSSCLLLASAHLAQAEPEWPSNLAQHEKHWPEQEALVKRDAAIRARMAVEVPRAVRKMSDDPGQKFYFDYWEFAAAEAGADTNQVAIVEGEFLNVTLLPPALKHSEDYGRHWNFPRMPQGINQYDNHHGKGNDEDVNSLQHGHRPSLTPHVDNNSNHPIPVRRTIVKNHVDNRPYVNECCLEHCQCCCAVAPNERQRGIFRLVVSDYGHTL
ncbi:hypothetical protein BC567DRAFT_211183 [Phyllosticta citribraziliensis]